MAYAITHLTGRAHLWGAEDWDRQMPAYSSFQAFAAELRKGFGSPDTPQWVNYLLPYTRVQVVRQGFLPPSSQSPPPPPMTLSSPLAATPEPGAEPIQLSNTALTTEEWMQVQPLYVLWWKGALRVDLSDKRADSPVGQELRVSQTSSPPKPLRPLLRVCLLLPRGPHELTLIDLGADACLISRELAQQLGLGREPLP